MKAFLITLAVIVVAVLIGAGGCISIKNGLIREDEEVTAAWSQVENQLKRRADLIPNLLNTVKGFAKHETDAIQKVADARAKLSGANAIGAADRARMENELTGALGRLLVVVENYPNLKADTQFKHLMDELSGTENRISVARRDYNNAVQRYNTNTKTFPGSLFHFPQREYFEIAEQDKAVPKVEF